jgi:hypothetical protein
MSMNHYERIGRLAVLRCKVYGLQRELEALSPAYVDDPASCPEAREPFTTAHNRMSAAGDDLQEIINFLAGAEGNADEQA